MPVIPLTLTISLCLVFTFVIFFLCERARGGAGGAEHDSLLPLAEETPRLARVSGEKRLPVNDSATGCGCHSGRQAPCPGCLTRPGQS